MNAKQIRELIEQVPSGTITLAVSLVEAAAYLASLLVDRQKLERHVAILSEHGVDHRQHKQLLEQTRFERILADGPAALADELSEQELAELLLDPINLADLFDGVNELEFSQGWWDALADSLEDPPQETYAEFKARLKLDQPNPAPVSVATYTTTATKTAASARPVAPGRWKSGTPRGTELLRNLGAAAAAASSLLLGTGSISYTIYDEQMPIDGFQLHKSKVGSVELLVLQSVTTMSRELWLHKIYLLSETEPSAAPIEVFLFTGSANPQGVLSAAVFLNEEWLHGTDPKLVLGGDRIDSYTTAELLEHGTANDLAALKLGREWMQFPDGPLAKRVDTVIEQLSQKLSQGENI